MKPDILLIKPLMKPIEDALDARYTVHRLCDTGQVDSLQQAMPAIRAVVTGGGRGLSNEWIEKLPALGVIAINGVGTDKVNLPFARDRGIHVTTTPGVLTDDVADMGLALLLAVLRRIPQGDSFVKDGLWPGKGFPLGRSPKGKRVGILGLGLIGRAFARRAEACGMVVQYWNRSEITDVSWRSMESPILLANESDILVVCVAATASTHNIVNKEVLQALGCDGVLINIARGSVVDEDALLAALDEGTIAAAGLDVFVNEPNIRPDFFTAPNTVLMPHQASATYETRIAMGNIVVENLAAFFEGRIPPTTVNS
ncbi:2-hydroxyacid dehydrogenase [Rhizobium sp. ZPR3]|uniref:2-hydroxyacid dehydrogenase n=2 Tax=unclassified Rhizobium TaxID=2613769 RepID=A0AAU7SPS0_9HYPH